MSEKVYAVVCEEQMRMFLDGAEYSSETAAISGPFATRIEASERIKQIRDLGMCRSLHHIMEVSGA